MYYEEKLIDGVLMFRSTPHGDWRRVSIEETSKEVGDSNRGEKSSSNNNNRNPFECWMMTSLKDSSHNGGYNKAGDENLNINLYIMKGGVSVELNGKDVKELMACLSSINPSIRVS